LVRVPDKRPHYVVRGNRIAVTADAAPDADDAVCVYDVRSLLIARDPPAGLAVLFPEPDPSGPPPQELWMSWTPQQRLEQVATALTNQVDCHTWAVYGGSYPTITHVGGRLIIDQAPGTHRKVLRFLNDVSIGPPPVR
jgi:hypothetical protein